MQMIFFIDNAFASRTKDERKFNHIRLFFIFAF